MLLTQSRSLWMLSGQVFSIWGTSTTHPEYSMEAQGLQRVRIRPAVPIQVLWLLLLVIKRHLKFMIALSFSSLLTLIRPVGIYLGPTPFLANITVVFMHPARTVGSQLEVTVFSIVGALVATAWILLCELSVAAYNKNHQGELLSAWVIEAIWFFFGIWLMTTLKARYAKLSCTFLIFTIANIFIHGKMLRLTRFNMYGYVTVIGPMMAGVGICLLVSILFWPETASEGLGRALNESLDTSRALLDLSTRSFLLNHRTIALPKSVLENAQAEVRDAQKKLYSAYREARYEVTYSRTDPSEYKEVRVVVSALMRHLGSMSLVVQNERLLMLGHPDRNDDDLLSGSSPDSSDSGNDDDQGSEEDSDSDTENGDHGALPGSVEYGHPLNRKRSRQSMDKRSACSDGRRPRESPRRSSAEEVRRIRQLLLRAENSTESMLKARQAQQEKDNPVIAHNPTITSSIIERSKRDSVVGRSRRAGHGSLSVLGKQLRPYSSAAPSISNSRHSSFDNSDIATYLRGTGKVISLPPSPTGSITKLKSDKSKATHGLRHGSGRSVLSLEKTTSSAEDRVEVPQLNAPQLTESVGGGLTEHQIKKAAEAFKKERKTRRLEEKKLARAEKKRLAKKEEEEALARAMPPKEVAFGDRRLFMSFLDIVREPLQRLSDSCSRVIVVMEQEIVTGLSVEQDRLERIRKRNAQRESIIRKADAIRALERQGRAQLGLANPDKETGRHESRLGGSVAPVSTFTPDRSRWVTVRELMGIKPHILTQDELDYADAVRKTSGPVDPGKLVRSSRNSGDGPGQNSSRQKEQPGLGNDETESSLPENVSSVQYLTKELEIFDAAEAEGLRTFIAQHPALDVGPREEIFLIFFFIFAIREIARELLHLGKHVEALQERQQRQMEKEGRKKLRKKFWWPKVIGNFWRWFSWGSYSKARNTEGYSGLVMNSSRNLMRNEPRLVEEERIRVEAKAARARAKALQAEEDRKAEQAAEMGQVALVQRRPKSFRPRRSVTLSTMFRSNTSNIPDIEHGLERGASIHHAEHSTVIPSFFVKRQRSTSFLPQRLGVNLDSCGVNNADPTADRGDNHVSGSVQEMDEKLLSGPSGRYTVVDIPEFEALRPNDDHGKVVPASVSKYQNRNSIVPLLRLPTDDDVDEDDDSENDVILCRDPSQPRPRSKSVFASFGHHTSNLQPGGQQLQEKSRSSTMPAAVPDRGKTTRTVLLGKRKPKTFRYRLWEMVQPFKSDEVKYGFKMAIALTFIGLWAWLEWNVAALATDRGQWAMMTVMAVLSPTIGATIRVCLMRVAGSLIGTGWAIITYLAYPNNPYVICVMMMFISFVVAFLILQSKYPVMGIIMMLSYSSVTFAMYHGKTNETVYEVSYKRTITVTLGILISVILNTFLWPVLARRELRKEIALLIGRQGVLFAELVNKYLLEDTKGLPLSKPTIVPTSARLQPDKSKEKYPTVPEAGIRSELPFGCDSVQDHSFEFQPSEDSCMTTGSGRRVEKRHFTPPSQPSSTHKDTADQLALEQKEVPDYQSSRDRGALDPDRLAFQHVEHQLQTKIIKINELLELSGSEPRLKEEFPMKLYKKIVQCCQNILDRTISMRMAAQLLSPEVRELVTGPMNYYRRDMVGALLLYFSVLSSSLASKTPLPPYLPSARMARLRVIYNVREAITLHQAESGEDHYTYIYYYAFSSALEEVIEELELLAILIKPLVGITYVSCKEEYVCGVPNDQLSFRSAIESAQGDFGPLEPAPDVSTFTSMDLSGVTLERTVNGSTTGFGLGVGISDVPSGIGPLDADPLSPQKLIQKQLFGQQIQLQQQQQEQLQQEQTQEPMSGVNPDLVIFRRPVSKTPSPQSLIGPAIDAAPISSGSKQAPVLHGRSPLANKPMEGLYIIADPFDPRRPHTGPENGSLYTGPAAAVAASFVGSPTGPIMTKPSTPSPIPIMDQRLLGTRHAQRYKEALQLAQEASADEEFTLPSPILKSSSPAVEDAPAVTTAEGIVGSVLSPTLSLTKRLVQKLVQLNETNMYRTTALAMTLALLFINAANGLVYGVDSSSLVSQATFTKAKGQGFTKAIIRGYQEACSNGGRVDPNFVPTYNNARAAGITNIDMYWFPCTGSGNQCKSFATQLSEIGSTFNANSMKIGTIWVDIEADNICNGWNYGPAGNLAKAQDLIKTIKASGYNYGIYSSPGEWGNIFGSRGVVLDNSAPLWFATFNNVQTLTMSTPFGGWTTAVGHQYTDQSASGQFDLNVFAN
ncbi:hypothetical protein BGZ83_001555 [Gryganskiella cystojenkinii]|nr:hypothetical protein BGZ83_001555 [Gryganskiella cystojenkinii]